MHLYTS